MQVPHALRKASGRAIQHPTLFGELVYYLADRARMCNTPTRSVSEVAIFLAYASG